jgi:hypothetical protein
MLAAAIAPRYHGHVEDLEPDDVGPPRQELDPHLEDAWFSRGETELAVQIVAIDRDPTDDLYLPAARSYRMPIAVGVMLASSVSVLLIMF